MITSSWKKCRLLLLLITFGAKVMAQQADTGLQEQKPDFISKLQKLGTDEAKRSIAKYNASRIVKRQKDIIEDIKNTVQRANLYMLRGIDTSGIVKEMERTEENLKIVNDGIFVNTGTVQTQRNLTVSYVIMGELLKKMTSQKNLLKNYTSNLINFRDKIDSLSADTALYTFPKDSVDALKYIKQLTVVAKEIGPTDSALNKSLLYVRDLQNNLDLMVFSLRSAREDIEKFRKELTDHTLDREFANITGPVIYSRPLSQIIWFSLAKERLAFNFYFNDNKGKLIIVALFIMALFFFLRSLKHRLEENKGLDDDLIGQLIIHHPFLSAAMIISCLFQFIFIEPPYIFIFCFWLLPAICLSIIFRESITKYWMRFWICMLLLFVLASTNNILLQASRTERWFMLVLALAGILYGTYVLLKANHHVLREKGILYFIAFMVIFETASALFNIFGRYNFSKTLLISGYAGLVIAILFLWTVRLINQGLSLVSRVYERPDKRLFYINFDRVGNKVPPLFYFFLVFGWFILVGKNFYEFKQIAAPFNEFLTEDRTLGDYTFTVNSLFVFFLVLISSVLVSRIISFFASEPDERHHSDKKTGKVGLGSWLLLIRIVIICIGLFLAFAAAGIPMDKLTIIFGALSVGVGLGLQGLVNNLVSGLIIAFEKPVNVGDIIEVNNKSGTMKSIGFRSSVVTLSDGACLIIPNGDLLSQHLVNWTMGKNLRRLNLNVAVAYGTELEKVKLILQKIIEDDHRILKYPASQVVPKSFTSGTIEFELYFWINSLKDISLIKGDVIVKINTEFDKAGIVIPFPQQDIYIKSFLKTPSDNKEIPGAGNAPN